MLSNPGDCTNSSAREKQLDRRLKMLPKFCPNLLWAALSITISLLLWHLVLVEGGGGGGRGYHQEGRQCKTFISI